MKPVKLVLIMLVAIQINLHCSGQSIEIENTKWVYRYCPNCQPADSLIFFDTLFIDYNSEIGLRDYGMYFVKNDTIFFHQQGEIWMYHPPKFVATDGAKNIRGRAVINENGKLEFLSPLRFEDGKWIDTGTKLGENSILEKVK